MDALIVVDVQNDFLTGGALAVPAGNEVVTVANRLMPQFDLVVATMDWHPADHGSFAANHPGRQVGELDELGGLPQVLWPAHCVQGTRGAELAPGLETRGITTIVRKGADPGIDSYSAFFDNGRRQATGLDAFLRANGVTRVFILGLATDYCVQFTALDAARLGYDTRVVVDGCRGVEVQPGDVAAAVAAMRDAGVQIVHSDEVNRKRAVRDTNKGGKRCLALRRFDRVNA